MSRRVTRGGEQSLAGGDDPNGIEDVFGARVFEQEAARSAAQRLIDVVVEIERGQHDDPQLGELGIAGDPAGGLQSVESWHPDVHEDDVRPHPPRESDGVGTVLRFADQLEVVGVAHHRGEPGPHQRLIVGDDDPDGHDSTAP